MAQVVTAIIVTHNSGRYLEKCLEKLGSQSFPVARTIIVDSGSESTDYLDKFKNDQSLKLIYRDNIGFSRANNLGYVNKEPSSEFIIFLNPDTFLSDDFVKNAVAIMNNRPKVGILSGKLLRFDFENNKGTGKIDSTGIFRNLYGRWYDRGQYENDQNQYPLEEEVPALCGALLFCRDKALIHFNDNIFDPDFFLYKEDIELSLRVKKHGWKLLYSSKITAYHCRGWKKRADIPFKQKRMAAESEILLYKKHPSPYILWALFKYILVTLCRC